MDIRDPKHEVADLCQGGTNMNGRHAALNKFLSRSTNKYKPFFQVLKKNVADFSLG